LLLSESQLLVDDLVYSVYFGFGYEFLTVKRKLIIDDVSGKQL